MWHQARFGHRGVDQGFDRAVLGRLGAAAVRSRAVDLVIIAVRRRDQAQLAGAGAQAEVRR